MNKYQILGQIHKIEEQKNISASFRKRNLILKTGQNGDREEFRLIEFQQEKCDLLNSFHAGDNVRVEFIATGRMWISPENKEKYFNTDKGWNIALIPVTKESIGAREEVELNEDDDLPF